jgi:glycosyltransferase involved in cell wall biosynthesis
MTDNEFAISILICSLHSRKPMLDALLHELDKQIRDNDARGKVDILLNIDNKEKSTGAKRDELLRQATGEYIIFIDDDDWIEPCYISELLKACTSGADCFGMVGYITTNGTNRIEWRLSKDYENRTIKENGYTPIYLRKTNHITGVKRSIALQAGFPDKSNAEDKAYSDVVAPLCKTECNIIPCMYHYRFQTHNKEYV